VAAGPMLGVLRSAEEAMSPREREIIARIAAGESTAGIAAALVISENTVRTHIRNAMRKTGAHSRAQLVALTFEEWTAPARQRERQEAILDGLYGEPPEESASAVPAHSPRTGLRHVPRAPGA